MIASSAQYLFDTLIFETAVRILSPAGYKVPKQAKLRDRRAALIQSLPASYGGGGLITAANIGPAAYIASCTAVGSVEPLFNRVMPSLEPHLRDALDAICSQCRCKDHETLPPAIRKALDISPDGLILLPLYSPDLPPIRRKKLQLIISKAISQVHRALLLLSCDPDIVMPTRGQDLLDMLHVSLLLLRSQSGRILRAP